MSSTLIVGDTMDWLMPIDDDKLEFLEGIIRKVLPSTRIIRPRWVNRFVDVSFDDPDDFLTLLMAVAAANLECQALTDFSCKTQAARPFSGCILRLRFGQQCAGVHVGLLFSEIIRMQAARQRVDPGTAASWLEEVRNTFAENQCC